MMKLICWMIDSMIPSVITIAANEITIKHHQLPGMHMGEESWAGLYEQLSLLLCLHCIQNTNEAAKALMTEYISTKIAKGNAADGIRLLAAIDSRSARK
jgi:hypothetical protein